MKYTLTIHADSVTELLDALNTATSTTFVPPIPDEPRVVPSAKSIPDPDDPRTVYGPGNGPVDAVRTATPVEPTEPEQDLTGWDERIHAASKTRNSDGSWRKKRGVSDELVAVVETELRGDTPDATETPDTTDTPTAEYTPQDVMRRLGELVTNGDFTPADIRQVATDCGLSEIVEIAQDYDALQRVTAYLREKAVM
uniref:Uncharacterized protein n=1 Tax=Pseudo-nitzschia multiseries DNA virus TaxID=2364897 RepID=A0A678W3H4_9VIRU|nr:conserved hypothetical protein [Pseudo-nitzschia multiseries DNA virus]